MCTAYTAHADESAEYRAVLYRPPGSVKSIVRFWGKDQTEAWPMNLPTIVPGAIYRLEFEGNADGGPNEIIRGDDHGIVLLDAADVPAITVDLLASEVLADKTVFKVPPGDRFLTLKTSWGAVGNLNFRLFMYAAMSGDDRIVYDSPGEYAGYVADPLGHIINTDIGVMKTDIERVRVKNDATLSLTFIISGFVDSQPEQDDGRWYLDFEDV